MAALLSHCRTPLGSHFQRCCSACCFARGVLTEGGWEGLSSRSFPSVSRCGEKRACRVQVCPDDHRSGCHRTPQSCRKYHTIGPARFGSQQAPGSRQSLRPPTAGESAFKNCVLDDPIEGGKEGIVCLEGTRIIPRPLEAFTEVNTGLSTAAGRKRGRGTAGPWDVGVWLVLPTGGNGRSFVLPASPFCPMARMAVVTHYLVEPRGWGLEDNSHRCFSRLFLPSSEAAVLHAGSSQCFAVVTHIPVFTFSYRNRCLPRVHTSFTHVLYCVWCFRTRQCGIRNSLVKRPSGRLAMTSVGPSK